MVSLLIDGWHHPHDVWLPLTLPPNVRIVISVTADALEGGGEFDHLRLHPSTQAFFLTDEKLALKARYDILSTIEAVSSEYF